MTTNPDMDSQTRSRSGYDPSENPDPGPNCFLEPDP